MSGTFWKPATVPLLLRDDDEDGNENVAAMPFYNLNRRRGQKDMPLMQQRMLLPIYKHKRQICYAMEQYGVVIIVGETGSGKSTQIPQYLMESDCGWTAHDFAIVCTQPRRIAATSLATRVAQEVGGGRLGDVVGYTVRFDDQTSPQTQVKVRNKDKRELSSTAGNTTTNDTCVYLLSSTYYYDVSHPSTHIT